MICLFGKWYNEKFFEYKTYCTNNTLDATKMETSNTTIELAKQLFKSKIVDEAKCLLEKEKISKINYKEFDKECIELCKTLNTMDGLNTTESCCGHLKNNFIIFFRCDNFSTLAQISRSVNKNYSDGKWELLVVDTDTYPCCNFWLRSKEPFKTESEMNESVNRLIDNLKYWQKVLFKEYFSIK